LDGLDGGIEAWIKEEWDGKAVGGGSVSNSMWSGFIKSLSPDLIFSILKNHIDIQ